MSSSKRKEPRLTRDGLPYWMDSDERVLLLADLMEGRVPIEQGDGMTDEDVYHQRPEFATYPLKKFIKFLESTRNAAKKQKEKEMQESWRFSRSRKLLVDDIVNGKVPLKPDHDDTEEVFKMRPEFQTKGFDSFAVNLANTRQQIAERKVRAARDEKALAHDRQINPIRSHKNGKPRWEGSEGERLLKEAIDQGIVEQPGFKPKVLFESKEEWYNVFTLKDFRGHIKKELRTRKFVAFYTDFEDKRPSAADELLR